MMGTGNVLLRLGNIIFAAVLHQIRIAYTNKRIRIIKQNFRLGPTDDTPLWRIRLDSRANPCGISVVIIGAISATGMRVVPHVPYEMASMVVEPIKILAI